MDPIRPIDARPARIPAVTPSAPAPATRDKRAERERERRRERRRTPPEVEGPEGDEPDAPRIDVTA